MKGLITVLFCFTFFLTVESQSKVLIISDIDDTIKVSHILSYGGALSSAFDDSSHFAGMPQLFQALSQYLGDAEFHYVSLAPSILMQGKHAEFLMENEFPITKLYTNPELQQNPLFKQQVIRQILASTKADLVLYFGDNGQFDPEVYQQMVAEFSSVPSIVYIREAYSSLGESKLPTKPGQIGFVTTMELAMDLIQKRLLPEESLNSFEQIVYEHLRKEHGNELHGPMVLPWWIDCRDFKWVWNWPRPSMPSQFVKNRLDRRCSRTN